jgi:hypothetical protein
VLDGPAELFDRDEDLSKAGIDSRLARVETRNSRDCVLIIQYETVNS